MLTPIDIENMEFKKVALGYSQEEVDDFLDKVIADFERLYKDNSRLNSKIVSMEENVKHYEKLENSIKEALVLAEKTGEQAKEQAEKEARNIVEQAKIDAGDIIHNANKKLYELNTEITMLKREYETVKAQLRTILESHIKMLDSGSEILKSTDEQENICTG